MRVMKLLDKHDRSHHTSHEEQASGSQGREDFRVRHGKDNIGGECSVRPFLRVHIAASTTPVQPNAEKQKELSTVYTSP